MQIKFKIPFLLIFGLLFVSNYVPAFQELTSPIRIVLNFILIMTPLFSIYLSYKIDDQKPKRVKSYKFLFVILATFLPLAYYLMSANSPKADPYGLTVLNWAKDQILPIQFGIFIFYFYQIFLKQ
jgi:hypothetical protein